MFDAGIGGQSTDNCEIVKGTTCSVFSDFVKLCQSIVHTPSSTLCIPSPNFGEVLPVVAPLCNLLILINKMLWNLTT